MTLSTSRHVYLNRQTNQSHIHVVCTLNKKRWVVRYLWWQTTVDTAIRTVRQSCSSTAVSLAQHSTYTYTWSTSASVANLQSAFKISPFESNPLNIAQEIHKKIKTAENHGGQFWEISTTQNYAYKYCRQKCEYYDTSEQIIPCSKCKKLKRNRTEFDPIPFSSLINSTISSYDCCNVHFMSHTRCHMPHT